MSAKENKRSMVISLIGRPNVGKSTLFNRLMRKGHKAITYDEPGVTRDRHYGIANFDALGEEVARDAILVDTGGFYPTKIEEKSLKQKDQIATKFFNIMTEQAKIAIEESDLILFVVDVREGVLPFDHSIADYIRTKGKNFWLIVNKFDSENQTGDELEFYALGIEEEQLITVSAEHALGLNDLRRKIHEELLLFEKLSISKGPNLSRGVTPRENVVAKVALIGAPNAGKSTLLNQLVGSERALVSDIPGTTVDPIEGFFDLFFGALDAQKLDGSKSNPEIAKTDGLLLKQYEEFRKNNAEVFEEMMKNYLLEEEAVGEKNIDNYDEYEGLDIIGESEELILSDISGHVSLDQYQNEEDFSDEYQADLAEDWEEEMYETVFADEDENENDDEEEAAEEISDEFELRTSEFDEEIDQSEIYAVEDRDETYVAPRTTYSHLVDKKDDTQQVPTYEGSFWRSVHLIDTAGIRRQKSVEGFIEEQSVYRSLRCITESDIVIYMVDATIGISHQDRRLLDIALEKGKSVIVGLNKIDLLKEKLPDEKAKKQWLSDLRDSIPWLYYCDLIPMSAKYGKHLSKLKDVLKKTIMIRRTAIPTGILNRALLEIIENHPIVLKHSGGKRLKVKYASMVKSDPPTFLLFSNRSQGIPENYKSYLKNGLRKEFGLDNTPIHLVFRTGEDLTKRLHKRMKQI